VLGRYQELLHFVEDDAGKENVERKQLNLLSHMPLLSMMNTKYILSPYPFDSCLLKLIFSEKVTHFEVPLYLYENLQVLPPFYFASSTHFLREGALGDNFKLLTSAEIDPTKTTFIECDTCRDKPFVKDLEKKVTLVTRDASHAVFHTESSTAEWLVLSNTFVPGWHATIDGKLAQIYYANYVYQAIEIEPGKHIVSFSYDI
jgi:hypothetical protein